MKYTSEIIQQICNKINLVDYISQYTELEERKGEYWCCCPLPDHNEDTPSFSINDNKYYCFGCGASGGLINFYMDYHKKTFPEAMEALIKLTNIDITQFEYSNIMEYLHKICNKKCDKPHIIRTYLCEDVINKYTKIPITEWLIAGILQSILDKYDVRYNYDGNAIVYVIRDINGKIIAIKARTLYSNCKDLGISKYIYYQPIGTNDFLFGLFQNKENVIVKKEVICVEGAKGVMLAESQGYDNVVSFETNHINEHQMELLLSLKVRIVLALDKGAPLDIKVMNLLSRFTDVYYMKDTENLLKDKDCPFDISKEVSDKLYNTKIKYTKNLI